MGHARLPTFMALIAVEEGRFDECWRSRSAPPTHHSVWTRAMVGRARLETGDVTAAIEALDDVVRAWEPCARLVLVRHARRDRRDHRRPWTTEHAGLLVDELEPYAGELVVGGPGIFCAGAADRYRGMLLDLLGRRDEAVAALTAAVVLEVVGRVPDLHSSHPLLARTRPAPARRAGRPGTGPRRDRPLHGDCGADRHVGLGHRRSGPRRRRRMSTALWAGPAESRGPLRLGQGDGLRRVGEGGPEARDLVGDDRDCVAS